VDNHRQAVDASYPAPAIYKDNLPIAMGMPFTPRSPNPRILDPGRDVISQKTTQTTALTISDNTYTCFVYLWPTVDY